MIKINMGEINMICSKRKKLLKENWKVFLIEMDYMKDAVYLNRI